MRHWVKVSFIGLTMALLASNSLLLANSGGDNNKIKIPTGKMPQITGQCWNIGNDNTAWAISKTTGEVVGGWNMKTGERYIISMIGRYHLEDRKSLVTGIGSDDEILKSNFDAKTQRIELTCSNPKVPDLVIKKSYWIRNNKLFEHIGFTTSSSKLQFITYNSQVEFDKNYRDAGYYMGGGDGGWPLIPAPNISSWKKVTSHRNTTKGMVLSHPEKQYSVAHIRTRLDDKFVWPWFTGAIATYCEQKNVLHYTPNGWDMSLGTSRLSKTKETSYEQYISIFNGDWQIFLTHEYPLLPEVKEAYKEIPPTPEWVSNIVADSPGKIDRVRRLLEVTEEGNIMVLVCGLAASWADYYVDEGLEGKLGGNIKAKELRDLIKRLKALSPRVKVGLYMWSLSTFENCRIYQKHPDWFRTTNKNGEICNTFPGFANNFAQLLSIPECYNELLSQFDLVLKYLDTDFIYLDDPKAINPIDWESGEYTRDDMCFQFFLDIKRIAAKHGPDKMVFFNNMCNPYADINYIEGRGELNPNFWRYFAGNVVIAETNLNSQPDSRIVLLYYIRPYKREYINRTLAMGWIPETAYCDILASRPFLQAAYEIGNGKTVQVQYVPDWKRDKTTNIESYALQRNDDPGYLLSFISHEEKAENISLELDLTTFKLDPCEQVSIWEYCVENADVYEGISTERFARKVYGKTGWQIDRATQRKLIYAGPYREKLKLKLNMSPLQLYQLYVTNQLAAVYSENGLPENYLFSKKTKVNIHGNADWANGLMNLQIDSSHDNAEVLVFLPLNHYQIKKVTVDGKVVKPTFVWENNNIFPLIAVSRGHHLLNITFVPAEKTKPYYVHQHKVTVATNDLHVNLPGCDKVVLTIEKDGRLFYNRTTSGKNGEFILPLAAARKDAGIYRVSLKAVIDEKGYVQLVKTPDVTVDLPAALPNLNLTPNKPEMLSGKCEIVDVNREIDNLKVLKSGVIVTDTIRGTFQPELETLMAQVDPDKLLMEAGTTRKVEGTGAAFAGLEIKNLQKVKLKLGNTFYKAFHFRGKGHHTPAQPNSANFAGLVIDYHTSEGYTKRVRFAIGVLHSECSSIYPDYGKPGLADAIYDLGLSMIESPEKVFALNLKHYAPKDWDGQVWLSVGSDSVPSDRRLTLQILASNDAVSDGFTKVTDPRAFVEAYNKPRMLEVPTSPGGILIDGPSNEEWWRGAAITEEFYLYGGKGISKAKTTAKLLYDDTNLYVAFICTEPDREKPLIKGGAAYDDDEVEVWIDVNGNGKTFKQIIVNAANEKMEFTDKGPSDLGAETAVYADEGNAWMVEMTIPFKGLGIQPPKPGDKLRISLCRYRPEGKNFSTEKIVWAPLKKGSFKDLENFGTLIFGK